MREKIKMKKLSVLLAAVLFSVAAVFSAIFIDKPDYAHSETETSSSAGVLDMKDDFRFCGLDKSKTKTYFYSYNNVCTNDYGSYSYGLIPSENFGETVNTGNGEIVYLFNLEGNGEFLLIRTLSLSLEYEFLSGYNPSLSVSYKIDKGTFTTVETITPDNTISKIGFDEILSGLNLNSEELFIKISLNHDAAHNLPIGDVSIKLFSVSFDGMFNFVMKKGASLRFSPYYNTDLKFRAFIAKDVYDKLKEKYSDNSYDIFLGNIMFPADLMEKNNAYLEKKNLVFGSGYVKIGNYPSEISCARYSLSGEKDTFYTTVVNDVEYYYFDGYIRGIRLENLTRDFVSKSYIRIIYRNSDAFLALAAYKNQDMEENSRSAAYCAQKVIESNSLLSTRLNTLFLNNITDKYKNTSYALRKFYVDADFNIVYADETVYNTTVNETIILSDADKQSERGGYIYIGDNGIIKNGENIIYRNSEFDKAYPLNKTVINLYYMAQN